MLVDQIGFYQESFKHCFVFYKIVFFVQGLSLTELKTWAKGRMIPYHVPSVLKCVESIPRNAMGKVNKKHLVERYFEMKEH